MIDSAGKVILVTGGSRGSGASYVRYTSGHYDRLIMTAGKRAILVATRGGVADRSAGACVVLERPAVILNDRWY